tara:strand:- start:843 stop:1358 length:516 start_codon:yes stop_codon:yes gene_type:complete
MEQSIKDLLSTAQVKSELHTQRAEFCAEVQRVIKEQAETIAQLEEKLRNNDGPWLTWPVLRKAFLLGAGYGANYQASYVQDEVRDYEEDIYTTVCDNGLYMDISGNMTIDSSDLADHLRFRQINLADFDDIRSFLDMNDDAIDTTLGSHNLTEPTFNLDKSTDNETEQTES